MDSTIENSIIFFPLLFMENDPWVAIENTT